jgi:hypothetical protein
MVLLLAIWQLLMWLSLRCRAVDELQQLQLLAQLNVHAASLWLTLLAVAHSIAAVHVVVGHAHHHWQRGLCFGMRDAEGLLGCVPCWHDHNPVAELVAVLAAEIVIKLLPCCCHLILQGWQWGNHWWWLPMIRVGSASLQSCTGLG